MARMLGWRVDWKIMGNPFIFCWPNQPMWTIVDILVEPACGLWKIILSILYLPSTSLIVGSTQKKTPYETSKKKLLQCINVNVSFHSNLPENGSLRVAKFGVPASNLGIRIRKHFMDPQHAFTEVGVPTVTGPSWGQKFTWQAVKSPFVGSLERSCAPVHRSPLCFCCEVQKFFERSCHGLCAHVFSAPGGYVAWLQECLAIWEIGGEGCISSGSWRVVCVPTTNSHLPWRLPLVVVGDLIHDRYW